MYRWIILAITSVVFTLAGVGVTKRWIAGREPVYFIIALVLFTISSLLYMQALKFERLSILEVFWSTLAVVLTIAVGVFFFQEKISLQETIGIVLALAASVLLTVKF